MQHRGVVGWLEAGSLLCSFISYLYPQYCALLLQGTELYNSDPAHYIIVHICCIHFELPVFKLDVAITGAIEIVYHCIIRIVNNSLAVGKLHCVAFLVPSQSCRTKHAGSLCTSPVPARFSCTGTRLSSPTKPPGTYPFHRAVVCSPQEPDPSVQSCTLWCDGALQRGEMTMNK
jgi:hypothetical protein